MKKTLLLLALGACIASCNNQGVIDQLKHENDSLKTILSRGESQTPSGKKSAVIDQGPNVPLFDTCLILMDTARVMASHWDTFSGVQNLQYYSFIMYRSTIDSAFLVDSLQNVCSPNGIIIYLACSAPMYSVVSNKAVWQNPNSAHSELLWQPIHYDAQAQSEMADYIKYSSKTYLFDHSIPCPSCGVINAVVPSNLMKKSRHNY